MTPAPNVEIFDSPNELAAAAARDFSERAAASISERGRFVVALAGGSTPKATYELLAREYSDSIDWNNVHVFFGDERTVPPDDDDSNFKMATDALLSHVYVGSVHRMKGELDPALSAALYQEDVEDFFGDEPKIFDLVQLGIGDDGHTASLFPNTEALDITGRIAVANHVPQKDTTRLTLTKSTINAAREVRFLVAGEGKAGALKKVLEDDTADPKEYPSKMIQPENGPTWMLDKAAASKLSIVRS